MKTPISPPTPAPIPAFALRDTRRGEREALDLCDRFDSLAERFCALLKPMGFELTAVGDRTWEGFLGLDVAQRKDRLAQLETYVDLCFAAMEEGIRLDRSVDFLRFFCERNRLRLPPGTVESLTDEDIVEIYSAEQVQLFRNLAFLRICSYAVADLYVYTWAELFLRPRSVTESIMNVAVSVLTGSGKTPVGFPTPDHVLEERFSPLRRQFYIRQGICAPIFDSHGETIALLATLRARPMAELAVDDIRARGNVRVLNLEASS